MKKLGIIIITAVLLLGLGQCKKKEAPFTPNHVVQEGWVHITVKIGDDSKHEVNPNTGVVSFTNGDILYVGNNGKYVGQLEYSSTTHAFTGDLLESALSTNDYLHFYFAGGLSVTGLTAGETTSFNVDIHDQSQKLPVLSYGASEERYTSEEATYTIFLENMCGLVKFSLLAGTDSDVTVSGVKTAATIDFSHPSNPIVATGDDGAITLFPQTGTALWALMLPQDAMETTATIGGQPFDVSIPAVEPNSYIVNGISIANGDVKPFSVAVGRSVIFSSGNLQYQPSSGTWRFAPNQYDLLINDGGDDVNVGSYYTSTYTGWIDLFGWGAWSEGYDSPWRTSTDECDYTHGYVSTQESVTIDPDFGSQLNDGNTWRTLTNEEWEYVLENLARGDKRYMQARISLSATETRDGLILFPDNYDGSVGSGSYDSYYNKNLWGDLNGHPAEVPFSDWEAMEAAGAVFMPFAGYRYDSWVTSADCWGCYWTASISTRDGYGDNYLEDGYDCYPKAYYLDLGNPCIYDDDVYDGYSVRLVRDL